MGATHPLNMKLLIGSKKDKDIEEYVAINIDNGHIVYFDSEDYYCNVLNHSNLYVAPDVQFYSVPDGLYVFKDGIPQLQEEYISL